MSQLPAPSPARGHGLGNRGRRQGPRTARREANGTPGASLLCRWRGGGVHCGGSAHLPLGHSPPTATFSVPSTGRPCCHALGAPGDKGRLTTKRRPLRKGHQASQCRSEVSSLGLLTPSPVTRTRPTPVGPWGQVLAAGVPQAGGCAARRPWGSEKSHRETPRGRMFPRPAPAPLPSASQVQALPGPACLGTQRFCPGLVPWPWSRPFLGDELPS